MSHMLLQMLNLCGRHGQALLILGLICGVSLPQFAEMVRPYLPELVIILLCLNAAKIGWKDAAGSLNHCGSALGIILVLQTIIPCVLALIFLWQGQFSSPYGLAVLLVLSAPSVTATPNLVEILGFSPAPAMRLLIIGTAFLPLTILPMLWLLPVFPDLLAALLAAGKLCAVILLATGVGFVLRAHVPRLFAPEQALPLNGILHLLLGVIVIGLMERFQPTLLQQPVTFLLWLLLATGVNFVMQIGAFLLSRQRLETDFAIGTSVIAGNRNIALFLVALPASVMDPMLLFIACYQLPMYLTPLIMHKIYARAKA